MNAKEKGSVTLFVLVSMLFFVLFLTGMYLLSASREQTNYTETAKIKEIYEKDVNRVDDVYETIVSKNAVVITFDANGGKGTMKEITANKGEEIEIPKNEFTFEHHGFAKWNTKPNGTGEEYLKNSKIIVDEDITLYVMWANYGTEIQNPYGDIYSSLDSKVPIEGDKNDNSGYVPRLDNVFRKYNNYHINEAFRGMTTLDPLRTAIINGNNTNILQNEVNDKWVGIKFHACYSTTNIDLSNFQLIFKDQKSFNLQDAVNNNYIEPLVICESKPFQTFYWRNFGNLISGNSTDVSSYSLGVIFFKVKTKSNLIEISFSTNKSWDSRGDGLEIVECNDLELSIDPF